MCWVAVALHSSHLADITSRKKLLCVLSTSNIMTEGLNEQISLNTSSPPSIVSEEFQDHDSDMLDLYALVTKLQNQLVTTLATSQSQAYSNKRPPNSNRDDIRYLWRILNRRIPRHQLDSKSQPPEIYESLNAKGLQTMSENLVEKLQRQYREFRDKEALAATRNRASMEKRERTGSCNSLFFLPPPAIPLPSEATL